MLRFPRVGANDLAFRRQVVRQTFHGNVPPTPAGAGDVRCASVHPDAGGRR